MNKRVYFLNFNVSGNIKIYFNGILLTKVNENNGVRGGLYELNPYIISSGKQSISIICDKNFGRQLSPEYIEDILIEIHYTENGNNPPIRLLKKLEMPEFNQPQTSLFQTWEFDANVDYELPNRLKNAIDLSKENPNKLLADVVIKYKEVHTVLNQGNTKEYQHLLEESWRREVKSMYFTAEEMQNYILEQIDRSSKAKQTMQPLKDYYLEIGLDKKTVELIDNEGKYPLISIDNEGYIRTFGFSLYRDKTTGELNVY